VARRIADAIPRGRVVVTGTIRETATVRVGGTPSCLLMLDDGSGRVDLVFVGQSRVPGLVKGARCTVEGTARMRGGRNVILNPLHRFEPSDDQHHRSP
jgi:hypothetical protein